MEKQTPDLINNIQNDLENLNQKVSKRLTFMDIGRFIAIFFMVLSHIMLIYGSDNLVDSVMGLLIDSMAGPPAAPVFIFSMGFLIVFTKKTNLKPGIIRGLKIFLAGLILNFVRFVVPVAIGESLNIFSFDYYGNSVGENLFYFLFEVDILFFAGLAYIVVVFLLQFNTKILIPMVFLIVAFLSPMLWGINTGNLIFDIFMDLLWGDGEHVAFPVFPWLCYPLIGAWIGILVSESDNKKRLGKQIFLIGFTLLSLGGLYTLMDFEKQIVLYYYSGPGAIISCSGFVVLWLLFFKKIEKLIKGRLNKAIEYVSINLTSIYCIH